MALALALAGCVNFGPEPIPQEENTIGFQTVVGLPDVVRAGLGTGRRGRRPLRMR